MRLLNWFARLPIRGKLLAMVLLPLVVALPLVGIVMLLWANAAFDRLLVTKVRSDLAVANGYFERVLGEVGASASMVAESHGLRRELADRGRLAALLLDYKSREQLDFFEFRDRDGRLIASTEGLAESKGSPAGSPLPVRPTRASVELLSPEQWARLAPTLATRVPVPLVATRNAAPSDRDREDRAMVLVARAAVQGDDGRPIGTVHAGVLLNRNLAFIDHINSIVYPEGSLPFGSRGTATLFLDDVRISTNVRLFGGDENRTDGSRAIGTRVSQQVREQVLGTGTPWLGRAFVVNDWYVSGYQPLVDGGGQRVGMLYVGYLERPFTWVKYGMLLAIGLLLVGMMAAAALLSLRLARSIFAPLERMAETVRRVEAGDRSARAGTTGSGDEIGQLAGHLDRLLDTVDAHTRELDAKVAARTRELAEAQQQLVQSEKLAAIGQLTASIAHEVNNPIAVIQGNLDLVRELLGADSQHVRQEFELLDEQVERMRLIVTKLLQFARPTEFAGYVEAVDTARVVDDCLVLVGHLLAKTQITLDRRLAATRRPMLNRQELQQVLVNLLVNAIDAMPGGGRIDLASRDTQYADIEITVTDTGPGLGPELLRDLFKPFVTRKKDGTGLGLWISRSIVERYGGELFAADRDDGACGARFTLRLRT
ncbi:MAG: cache domain-containing protein [Aquincola sp.]|nr:cache domain-containing protein [Aquincola sp.]MDH4288976.1 cache domain-containing protein [Aquincola sp.]